MNLKFKLIILFLSLFSIVKAQKNYHPNHNYTYYVEWENIKTKTIFNDLVILKAKRGRANGLQRKIKYYMYPNLCVDSLTIASIQNLFCDTLCTKGCQNNIADLNMSLIEAKTGAIENKEEVWIHPPRSKYYKLLELSPFPLIKWNKNTYQSTIKLGGSWGVFSYDTITSDYVVENQNNGTFLIKAKSSTRSGIIRAEFIYSIESGFTNLEYWFFENYHITFSL
jgi:hypothetical protein